MTRNRESQGLLPRRRYKCRRCGRPFLVPTLWKVNAWPLCGECEAVEVAEEKVVEAAPPPPPPGGTTRAAEIWMLQHRA